MRILAWPAFDVGELNPYTRLLYGHMESYGVQVHDYSAWRAFGKRYDIFHLHWPEYYVAHSNPIKAVVGTIGLLLSVFWCRTQGAKVIWTVHNLGSHSRLRPRMEQWFWQVFTSALDGYICLTESGRKQVQQAFPALRRLPGFVIPHGHYRGQYPDTISSAEARQRLDIPTHARVTLFFGAVARYKNATGLIKAFRELPGSREMLFMAGACAADVDQERLRTEAVIDSRIRLHVGFVPREKVQLYFRAADLVVLPFQEILNSGSALLALSFNRPILVPAKGAMSELQAQFGAQWVRTYSGDLTASELAAALVWVTSERKCHNAPLDQFEWHLIAQDTLRAYRRISGADERPPKESNRLSDGAV